MMKQISGFLLAAGLLLPVNICFSSSENVHRVQVKALRIDQPVILDGKLHEDFWKDENAITDFKQRDPKEGADPTERTIVDVVYDDQAVYIGARMYDSEPHLIEARLVRRDVEIHADRFLVYLDCYQDRRSGYYFGINAAGTLYDGTLYNDSWEDDSWDGVWEAVAHVDEQGWTAEFRIPYSQLRFQAAKEQVWGVNFRRTVARKNEELYLAYTPKNESGFVSRFPDLVSLKNISPPRRIEVLPYFTTEAAYVPAASGDPFQDGSSLAPGMGVDYKLGLGTNLTLDGTVNPDFGQVEVDPAVVNLGDVETFFEEKRPFFIEGANTFRFGRGGAQSFWGFNWSDPLVFYSRRIGRTPQGSIPDADYQNVPDGVSILSAAKLTGKLGGWNVGTLHSFTAREAADTFHSGNFSQAEVEPAAYYTVSRGLKELDGGHHGIGMIAALSSRSFDDERLRDEFNSSSTVLGVDGWTFLDSDREWVLSGYGGYSQVNGNTIRITDIQQNSQHYFQRPDADYVEVDPDATSLNGYMGRLYLAKQKGNFFFNSAFGAISPGFDSNDLGFLWRADIINTHVTGGYRWTEPKKRYRYAEVGVAAFRSMDFGWNTTWAGLFHYGYVQFPNYYSIDYSIAWNPEETYNNTRTRGGPRTLNPTAFETNIFVNSDNRKKVIFGIGANRFRSDSSYFRAVNTSLEWKPVSNISLRFDPALEWVSTPAQWVGNFEDPFATNTFGARYTFGELDQRTFSSGVRLNWTFTPRLSLQFYGQPLVSSGDYTDFKELARPGSYDFNTYPEENVTLKDGIYTIDPDGNGPAAPFDFSNPDFNFKSLRFNTVLRWEYRPGSTIFFVWTQTREDEENIGNFRLGESLSRLWKSKADNRFLVKFTYYWNP